MICYVKKLCPFKWTVRYYHDHVALIHKCMRLNLNNIEEPLSFEHPTCNLFGLCEIEIHHLLYLFVFLSLWLNSICVHNALFEPKIVSKNPRGVNYLTIFVAEIFKVFGDTGVGLQPKMHRLSKVADVCLLYFMLHYWRKKKWRLISSHWLRLQG